MKYFRNKTILLTGANGGFGSLMTDLLLKHDAKLVLSDIGENKHAQHKNILTYIKADISTKEGCTFLYNQCSDEVSHIDILINNAGIAISGRFEDTPEDIFEKVMEVNLMAPIRLTRLFLPLVKKSKAGHLVFISSLAGHVPLPMSSAYSASKFGIRGFGLSLLQDIEKDNICVSNVYPIFARTGLLNLKHYGKTKFVAPPDLMIDDPDYVAENILSGISRKEAEIFPSPRAKFAKFITTYTPDISNFIFRRLG